MDARTVMKARLLDFATGVLEMARDGNRDMEQVCEVLQIIKSERDFAGTLFVPVILPVTEGEARAIEILGSDKVLTFAQVKTVWSCDVDDTYTPQIRYSESVLKEAAAENSKGRDWRLVYVHGLSLREQFERSSKESRVKGGFDGSEFFLHEKKYELEIRWVNSKPCVSGYYLVDFSKRFSFSSWKQQQEDLLGKPFERSHETTVAEVITSIYKVRRERLLKGWCHWGFYARDFSLDSHVVVDFSINKPAFDFVEYGHINLGICVTRKFDIK